MKASSQLKECAVCVCEGVEVGGDEGAELGEIMSNTQGCHAVSSDQSPMLTMA